MQKTLPKILVITGPTASGKSDLAIQISQEKRLRENLECVIISADSRQIYKYLDIGSGKITKGEMRDVEHFGLDIAEPKYVGDSKYKNYTAADWLECASLVIKKAISQNKLPIICGGTGLYIDALLYGIESNPPPDYKLRRELENKTLTEIQNLLKEKLKDKRPDYFDSLNNSEKNNRARLIRKLEQNNHYIRSQDGTSRDLLYNAEFIILKPEIKALQEKISLRLEKRLIDNLLINETRDLIVNKKVDPKWLISLGLEHKYTSQYLLGEITFEQMWENIILKSLQYAKKQIKWNKRYENISCLM